MTVVWVLAGAGVLVLALAIWAGRRMLPLPEDGAGDGPDHRPDDGHPRWSVDLQRSGVRLPRPR